MSGERSFLRRVAEPLGVVSSLLSIIQVASSKTTASIGIQILSFFSHFAVFMGVGTLVAVGVWWVFPEKSRPWAVPAAVAAGALTVVALILLDPDYYESLPLDMKVFAGAIGILACVLIGRSAVRRRKGPRTDPPEGIAPPAD